MTVFSTGTEEVNAADVRAGLRTAPGTVTVVVPTFNEPGNIRELLARLADSLPERLPDCEVLVVDDSTDDTPAVAAAAGRDCPFPLAVIHRTLPDGGVAGAVVEGLRAARTEWVVVMDADPQHPPSLVPELVEVDTHKGADLVVAGRYTSGGRRAGIAGANRVAVSRGATWLTKSLFPWALRGISDPMSGLFAIRRDAVRNQDDRGALRPLRYQIPLELVVRSRPRAVTEVPFAFQDRYARESKSTARDGMRFLAHPVGLRTASPVARALVFGLIGLTGFVPNLAALAALTAAGMHYVPAEILANQAGVLWNFLLIELLLFRERRRHRHWADRVGRFVLLANADLLLRLPLITLFVGRIGTEVLPATALALVVTFVLRFAGTEMLVYLPSRGHRGARGRGTTEEV